jgi:hypothetical protein
MSKQTFIVKKEPFESVIVPLSNTDIQLLGIKSYREALEIIFNKCIFFADDEKIAMQSDDYEGTCAASHRGGIRAYNRIARTVAELINYLDMENENENK